MLQSEVHYSCTNLQVDSTGGWIGKLHPAGGVSKAVGDRATVYSLHFTDYHLQTKATAQGRYVRWQHHTVRLCSEASLGPM